MRSTRDRLTGTRFRWNTTVAVTGMDGRRVIVPARCTSRTATHLHPDRVDPALLARLNAAGAQKPPAEGPAPPAR